MANSNSPRDPMYDQSLMALPHPVRFERAARTALDTQLLERLGATQELRPYLTDTTFTTEHLLNEVPSIRRFAQFDASTPGSAADTNLGGLKLLLTRARFRAHGEPLFQVTSALQEMLGETDLGAELPARFFRTPYPLVYIELARPNRFQVYNRQTGLHSCEGAYLGVYEVPAHSRVLEEHLRRKSLNLDPTRPARVIEITITGSPLGKAHVLDDASQDFMLFVQDEDECLQTLLERHIAFFNDPQAYQAPHHSPLHSEEVSVLSPIIFELAKILLYLNLPESRQQPRNEATELEQRMQRLGQKKAARLRRKRNATYDRIVVGPEYAPQPQADEQPSPAGAEGERRTVRPHWRRGHFRRIRYGEARQEVRVGWIQPTLVNAEQVLSDDPAPKHYRIRR